MVSSKVPVHRLVVKLSSLLSRLEIDAKWSKLNLERHLIAAQ